MDNDETKLDTEATEGQEDETLEEQQEESVEEAQGKSEDAEAETESDPLQAEREAWKAEKDRYAGRLGSVNGDKRLLAKVIKGVMDEYGLSYEEAAEKAGVAPEDLRSRVEGAENPSSAAEATRVNFGNVYYKQGLKATYDDAYGADTQPFVDAVDKYGLLEKEELEAITQEPLERQVGLLIKFGKKLHETYGDSIKGSLSERDKRIKELEAQVAAYKSAKPDEGGEDEDVVQKGRLPISGVSDIMAVYGHKRK